MGSVGVEKMSRRRCVRLLRKALHLLILCVVACVLLGEWMVFYVYSMRWDLSIPDRQEGTKESLRVLLLADPHIQCTFDKYERWLYRWDADVFLARSFRRLASATDPGLVVVLGDVFAEGFKASKQQWREYLECFRAIFPIPTGVERIVLYGDNDIGGEGRDVMNEEVLGRYEREFGPINTVVNVRGYNFVKVSKSPGVYLPICILQGTKTTCISFDFVNRTILIAYYTVNF